MFLWQKTFRGKKGPPAFPLEACLLAKLHGLTTANRVETKGWRLLVNGAGVLNQPPWLLLRGSTGERPQPPG